MTDSLRHPFFLCPFESFFLSHTSRHVTAQHKEQSALRHSHMDNGNTASSVIFTQLYSSQQPLLLRRSIWSGLHLLKYDLCHRYVASPLHSSVLSLTPWLFNVMIPCEESVHSIFKPQFRVVFFHDTGCISWLSQKDGNNLYGRMSFQTNKKGGQTAENLLC